MKQEKRQLSPWVTVAIVVSVIIAAAGIIFGLVKAFQAILTEVRYRALEKALREEDLDTDAITVSEDLDLDLDLAD